jgi:hypothetical protein
MRRTAALLLALVCLPAAIATTGASAAGCPNEALRIGPSALLPQCRAYEMVSPVQKNGSNISPVVNMHAAPNGEAAAFYSTAAFGDAAASPLGTAYLGRRGANWATEGVDAPQYNPKGLAILASPANSRDLTHTFGASKIALAPGAIEGGSNIYVRDNTTGARTLVKAEAGNDLYQQVAGVSTGAYLGGSSNWSNILMHLPGELVPGAPTEYFEPISEIEISTENIYEFEAGANPPFRIADVLPNGEIPATGARIGGHSVPYSHAISEDGRRTFFVASYLGQGPLYMREDGKRTVPVSVSQGGVTKGEVLPAEFGLASADGSVVYFTSSYEVVPGAAGESLYRWEAPTTPGGEGTVTNLTTEYGATGPQVAGVLAASQDGSYLYFAAGGTLTEDSPEGAPGETVNIYVWHDGETKLIASTEAGNGEFFGPLQWEASPDGHYFAFNSYSLLAGAEPSEACPAELAFGNAAEHCRQVYLYEFGGTGVRCLSCNGAPPLGWSSLGGAENKEPGVGDEYPHAVLDDGTVFVDTPNSLVTRDSNGVEDVYAWRMGTGPELISTGTSEAPSGFGDATLDGSSIFFYTGQSLVKADTDANVDVYVDREDGGLASQWPPASPGDCDGEGCRGAGPAAPAGLPPGSAVAETAKACRNAGANSAAKRATKRAHKLNKQAAKVAHRKGKAAKRKAKRLRRQAKASERQAKRSKQRTNGCGRNN